MSAGSQKRTRSQRVASIELPPGKFSALVERMKSGAVVARLSLAALLAVALLALFHGWDPPREFHAHLAPTSDVVAPVEFRQLDERATSDARENARRFAEAVYDNDPLPLAQLKAKVKNEVAQLAGADDLASADRALWERYLPPLAEGTPAPTDAERRAQFDLFREALATDEAKSDFARSLDAALAPIERVGVLDAQPTEANAEQVLVRPSGKESFEPVVPVRDVLIENVRGDLATALNQRIANLDVAAHVFARLRPDLPVTLKLNAEATRAQQDAAAEAVEPVYRLFPRGALLAAARTPLGEEEVEVLELAYEQVLAERTIPQRLSRGAGVLWLYAGLLAVVGVGLVRSDSHAVEQFWRYLLLVALALGTMVAFAIAHATAPWLELAPLMLLGMTLAVAYRHQTALVVSAAAAAIGAIGLGLSLGDGVVLIAPTACAIFLLDSVRHRSKLLVVGAIAGVVAVLTTLAVGALQGQPWMAASRAALTTGLWSVVAGSLMTCLLPIVERVFRVQTDLSLIELGDPANSLLQELVRRAPGTYNHSITVASLAEAAAEAIGARGLLVRVGAYYHDIGKILKPGYFVENQAGGANQHDALVPAMSTLVIIAHVKDGADLARQNRLPECIVDFILQHHGTTLVEYFYHQQQKRAEVGDAAVDESTFRYPGPKPQTREAGVLMLADAAESACRALVEPTSGRIENLVDQLARKRLDDGQFDECELTLEEVHKIVDSLVKSLTAVYHGRVKYPGQETA